MTAVRLLFLFLGAVVAASDPFAPAELDCEDCVAFMDEEITAIVNIIANIGIIGDCGDLCKYLSSHVDDCNEVCKSLGLETFVTLVEKQTPDQIFICEEAHFCKTTKDAKGQISNLNISPAYGPIGTKFHITADYTVDSAIATGQLAMAFTNSDSLPYATTRLLVEVAPGKYEYTFDVHGQHTENPGVFHVTVVLCEGTCASTAPYSYLLASQKGEFTVTK